MTGIHKESVREEVYRLKDEFEKLRDKGNVSTEVSVLMSSMLMIVELILSVFLEKKTKKDNTNSSIPSSQTDKDESSLDSKGSKGKGRGENSAVADNSRTIETVTLVPVDQCGVCGESLTDTPCQHIERRTKIDIVFEKVVEHVDAQKKQCPVCDSIVKGQFPTDLDGPLQYGYGLKVFIVNMLVGQMVAINRVQKLVKSMIGVVIAEATLLKFVIRLHRALGATSHRTAA